MSNVKDRTGCAEEINMEELELGILRAIERGLHNYFKSDEWEFQEPASFTGTASEQFKEYGGHGIILYFINKVTGEEREIKMPIKL